MRYARWYVGGALSTAVTATLVVTVSLPAHAGILPLPLPSSTSGGSLLNPSLAPLPIPTSLPPLLPPPQVETPAPTATQPAPGAPGGPTAPAGGSTGTGPAAVQPAPAQAVPAPTAVTPGAVVPPGAAAEIIASDPGADLYPQPPVDPATTPQARLVAQLNDVQHREQYLQNILIRTRADLAAAQRQVGPVPPLVALLTDGAEPTGPAAAAAQGAVGTPEGRVLALTSAVQAGRAELARRQTEALDLQRQVNSQAQQAMVAPAAAPAPGTPAGYGGGRLRRPAPGPITSPFGMRFDPYYHVWQLHAGVDIGAPAGAQIVAAAAGRVVQAGWNGGYGNYTCIDHGQVGGQRLTTCYGHQQKILATPGQQVSAGQVIGLVGSTGAATGPHLHFEVRLGGRPVDPMPWI